MNSHELLIDVFRCLAECDGAILMASNALESEAISAMKQWFAETGRSLYAIGPLLPLSHYKDGHNALTAGALKDGKSEVIDFLNAILANHGDKSLLYVCCFRLSRE